jgi:hypothetical protein
MMPARRGDLRAGKAGVQGRHGHVGAQSSGDLMEGGRPHGAETLLGVNSRGCSGEKATSGSYLHAPRRLPVTLIDLYPAPGPAALMANSYELAV